MKLTCFRYVCISVRISSASLRLLISLLWNTSARYVRYYSRDSREEAGTSSESLQAVLTGSINAKVSNRRSVIFGFREFRMHSMHSLSGEPEMRSSNCGHSGNDPGFPRSRE
jgi:hypothetical protein